MNFGPSPFAHAKLRLAATLVLQSVLAFGCNSVELYTVPGTTSSSSMGATLSGVFAYTTSGPTYFVGGAITANTPVSVPGTAPYTYSVLPALPAGLTLDTVTGAISGTPTAFAASTAYTIHATDSLGAIYGASVTFAVTASPVTLASGITAPAATVDITTGITATLTLMDPANVQFTSGGLPVTFAVTSTSGGSGTLSAVTDNGDGTYDVTFTGTVLGGVDISAQLNGLALTTPLSLTVVLGAAGAFSYATSPASYLFQAAITTNSPGVMPGAGPYVYSAVTPLPAGLSVNGATGDITGTPTALAAAANYTIQAVSATETDFATVNIAVDVPPATLSGSTLGSSAATVVSGGTVTLTLTDPVGNGVPQYGGLPVALSISAGPGAGTFCGSVTDVGDGTYTCTFTGTTLGPVSIAATINGQAVTTPGLPLVLTVIAAAPGTFSYTTSPASYEFQQAIAANAPGAMPGPWSYTYSAITPLPPGLSLDPVTGVISGTPTALSVATDYTIEAVSLEETDDAVVNIAVVVPAATLSGSTITAAPSATVDSGTSVTVTLTDPLGNAGVYGGLPVALAISGGVGTGTLCGAVTDVGDGTYTCNFTGNVVGDVWISATINGQAVTTPGLPLVLTVVPGAPDHITISVQPTSGTLAGAVLTPNPVMVLEDINGNAVTSDNSAVTVSLVFDAGPGATLTGATVTAVNGIATFDALSIDMPGVGYTIQATWGALTSPVSDPFDIN